MAETPERPKLTAEVPALPPRGETTHKAQVGRVAIIAGSRGMSGAACLAGLGALRGGAGLVRVLTAVCAQPIVAASNPCLMSVPLPETDAGHIAQRALPLVHQMLTGWADVLGLGPGLGQSEDIAALVAEVARSFDGPLIVDADGLNNLAKAGIDPWLAREGRPTILTPHPGELNRLLNGAKLPPLDGVDDEARLTAACAYCRATGTIVVLKGHRTVVCTPQQAYVNTTGNPGMATGGMGDVLTGFIAALMGQGLSGFDAARLGVYCHGLAADLCAQRIAPVGYLAHDVAEMLPAALAKASNARIGFK